MKTLDIIFNLSDRKMIFLENVENLGGYIVPFTLIILSVAYNFRHPYPIWAAVLGGISLIVIFIYFILIVYLYLRYRYLVWKKIPEIKINSTEL
ncbi:Uncharacterised protein [Streptococcus pyogenes]|uniref:hypothetical protein n=1 Tax=Streptococcus pyogenes TaxID=1314 RepID=UPI0010A160C9|nr:hypothetical protein [Streptococcus pyogenes]QCK24866.1 hypothetical protein ETT73_02165 [Streptococcus pyogenes]VGY24135.1 Uncharacterised protein [Streptococcus pyogenes]VGY60839.1 Uncharacterised protein [Streptococcus pyogenes]VGZ28079.1 Uncharacterised protein [Streptococcus pyogenes]VHA02465.1 Uncharacterised protein [Streptococcus pyogenes]